MINSSVSCKKNKGPNCGSINLLPPFYLFVIFFPIRVLGILRRRGWGPLAGHQAARFCLYSMDQGIIDEHKEGFRKGVEMAKSISDKHLDLLRPSARYFAGSKDTSERERGKYTLIRDAEDGQFGMYDKPLPCFGCGIGWFSFLVGFVCPLMWYYATVLYFGNFYRKDPRERAGLAASAIAAMISTVLLLIIAAVLLFTR